MEAGPTEVHVEVRAVTPTTSTLVLTHRLLSRAKAPEYGAGWAAYVGQLRDHLEGRVGGDWWAEFGASRDRAPRTARRMTPRDYPEMIGSAVSRALSKVSSTATRVRWAYGARARSSDTATEAR